MVSGHEQIKRVLARRGERPLRALGRSLVVGVLVGLVVGVGQAFTGFFESASPAADLLIGLAVSLGLWGADRLWFSMIAPIFHRPFSLPAYVSRLPFWYVAGGIAFETAVLAAASLGWLATYGIAVKFQFDMGARLGVLSAALLQAALYRDVRLAIRGLETREPTMKQERP